MQTAAQWSSRWMFILAATGSAVGLGNIWKFPYIAGENGGGAFVLVYLACVFSIGIPVMMAEIMIGRRGQQSPINAMHTLAVEAKQHPIWKGIGWSGVIAGFLILSFYSVIAGWALAYIPKMLSGTFSGITPEGAGQVFNTLTANPWMLLLWHSLFMGMTIFVIAQGVEKGLEKAVSVLMPTLFFLLVALVIYAAVSSGHFMQGVHFLFDTDFQALFYPGCNPEQGVTCEMSWQGVLSAMGLAFFSLSIGMGAIMMYGAYLPKTTPITSTTVTIAIADSLVALLAGLAIFPIVFANGLDPSSGPGLVFVTLPIAFGQMDGGVIFGSLFFILLVFAAWTSAFSLLEPVVAWLVESWQLSRSHAAIGCGFLIWLLGILSILSFNNWSDFHPLAFLGDNVFATKNFFDLFDYITSNIMLPLGGLFIAIFAAWIMSHSARCEEMGGEPADISYHTWLFLIRYVTPLGVLLVFLNAVGLLKFG
ncbi:sodium-dependent transporter [Candidatus Venteria ishoeyi]|uniref:Transporter n=1 Tax=Candidatus Venteria ishoeyi TaxID=1899563 RepID=A0A1H6FBY5_9GAMM|nr:sodium-dependent transporter [Candidatus Venteria ishoeyi]MDM8545139.1 sodium-dependent transporter [Candidatus Venteria ishoeyi]SEH06656.1 Sodium:neurotransmitter symporter family protein [Candidatus Venteria ishoeyi]